MDLLPAPIHGLHLAGSLGAHHRFQTALGDPEGAQRARLAAILHGLRDTEAWGALGLGGGYEELVRRVPPHTYAELEEPLRRQRATGRPVLCPPCRRWLPTSGSTSRRKWVPCPPGYGAELDAAAGAWMVDLAIRHPRAFLGRHYWSLSWVPEELRQGGRDSDDLELLPPWKRMALRAAMAVPGSVADLPSNQDAMAATAMHLAACPGLSLVSTWSPTFFLALLEQLSRQRCRAAGILAGDAWPWPGAPPRSRRGAGLLRQWDGSLDPGFFRALWPRLALVSTWCSAGSAPYAARLRALLPQAHLQGKGLWATEGVVSIPFRDRQPLALTSHFLEFRCLASERILPAWALEEGQVVEPLLTTSSGLLRYRLGDSVRVTGFLERTPTLEFLGRGGGTDLAGEKLDRIAVAALLLELGSACVTLFAVSASTPGYVLLAEGAPADAGPLEARLEAALCGFHHYRLARELGQLAPARAWLVDDAAAILDQRAQARAQVQGGTKPEALEDWGLPTPPGTPWYARPSHGSPDET